MNFKNINWHHVKMIFLIAITAAIGGIHAVSGQIQSPVIPEILAFLLFCEHILGGNSTTMVAPTK